MQPVYPSVCELQSQPPAKRQRELLLLELSSAQLLVDTKPPARSRHKQAPPRPLPPAPARRPPARLGSAQRLGAQPHVRAGRTRPGRPPPSPSSCAQSAGVPEARPGRLPRALLPPAGCGGWPGRTRAKTGRECAQARPSPPVPRPAGLRLRAGPAAVGQSARGVWPRAEARVALKGLPGGRGAGCGSGRGRQLTVFMFGRPTSEVELAKNRFPDPKCFWPGFPGRYCAKIQNLGEGEILGIWCTYGHPPLKPELNATKT